MQRPYLKNEQWQVATPFNYFNLYSIQLSTFLALATPTKMAFDINLIDHTF